MEQNVGKTDRTLRGVAGAGLMGYGLYAMVWWLIVVGGFLMLTGIIGFCTPYKVFRIDTRKKKGKK